MTAFNQAAATLELFVRQVRYEGRNIQSYELVDPEGAELPPFTAGAHIDVHLANGVIRQYSLCNSPTDRHRYVIAVLRDEKGRGGSKAVHEQLQVQGRVRVSVPRNNFELAQGARKVILIAGGIGVTPLKSMAHQLSNTDDVDYELHYCARDAQCAAFTDELQAFVERERLHFHFDGGDPARGLDIAALLRDEAQDGTHVYYCGPRASCAHALTRPAIGRAMLCIASISRRRSARSHLLIESRVNSPSRSRARVNACPFPSTRASPMCSRQRALACRHRVKPACARRARFVI